MVDNKYLKDLTQEEEKVLKRVRAMTPQERFVHWIKEREQVRLAKEAGQAPPWTDDPIIRRFRFTCPRRMDDRVSQWLLKNWYEPHFDHPNMLIACVLARHFNLPDVLERVGFPTTIDLENIRTTLNEIKEEGGNTFNSAYIVTGVAGMHKIDSVLDRTVAPMLAGVPSIDPDSLRATCDVLGLYKGIGTFMAGQIAADLRWAITGEWKDRRKWAPVGPGSRRGMNRVHGRPIHNRIKDFEVELLELAKESRKSLPAKITRRLESIDWQNCCCEFDKYERTVFENRKPKRTYPGQ